MDRVTNLILPRYEEGKKLYDKLSNEIAALLDTAASPSTDDNFMDRNVSSESADQDDLCQMKPFVCGHPLFCAEEEFINQETEATP